MLKVSSKLIPNTTRKNFEKTFATTRRTEKDKRSTRETKKTSILRIEKGKQHALKKSLVSKKMDSYQPTYPLYPNVGNIPYTPIYTDLVPEMPSIPTAPPAEACDIFDQKLLNLEDAVNMCKDIVKLLCKDDYLINNLLLGSNNSPSTIENSDNIPLKTLTSTSSTTNSLDVENYGESHTLTSIAETIREIELKKVTFVGVRKEQWTDRILTCSPNLREELIRQQQYSYNPIPLIVRDSTPQTTIIHNHVGVTDTNKNKNNKDKNDKDKKSNETSFGQKIVAGTIVAVAVPVAAHYLSKDYNKYVIYERIEANYLRLKKHIEKIDIKHCSQSGDRVDQIICIMNVWKSVRKNAWSEISKSVKTKAAGGAGVVAIGLSMVLGSAFGFMAGALVLGGTAAKMIWTYNTRDNDPSNTNKKLLESAKLFIKKNEITK